MSNLIRRANKRNFFIAQNMIFDLDISEHAKITYLYLSRCADDESQAFPSYNTIASKCSFSRRTAIDVIKELQAIGLLSVKKRQVEKDGKAVNTSNLYTLYDSPICTPSAGDAPPLVQEMHHPSAGDAPPLVQEMHHPSAGDAPYKYPTINTNLINNQSIYLNKIDTADEIDRIDESKKEKTPFPNEQEKANVFFNKYKNILTQNLNTCKFNTTNNAINNTIYDNIFNIMLDVVCSTNDVYVNGELKNIELVKSVFLKLDSDHIHYVVECINKLEGKIRNIRSYIITALYNAPNTIDTYYSNLVKSNHI